jgi:hypothetical protein
VNPAHVITVAGVAHTAVVCSTLKFVRARTRKFVTGSWQLCGS